MFPPMTETPPPQPTPEEDPHARWKFIRDVGVFELKLFINNVHNFFQVPLTLAVAAFDLIFKGNYHGERFYKLVEHGRTIDDAIDIYSVIAHREKPLNTDYTVDALVARLENVIVREYEKGGTAQNVRSALDRALDHVQDHTGKGAETVGQAVRLITSTIRPPGKSPENNAKTDD
ncbi:MAG TPA: hypothetical protein VGG36_11190 [Rhizomicrobium sp.]|jgi:hypothetical protein